MASHHSRAEASCHVAILGDGEKPEGPQVLDRHLPPGSGDHYPRDLFFHHPGPTEGVYEGKIYPLISHFIVLNV